MESPSLRLGVVSDLHFAAEPAAGLAYHGPFDILGVLDRLRAAAAWFVRSRVDALILAGDLTQDGDAASLDMVLQTVAAAWPGRAFVVAGNHESDAALAAALERLSVTRITTPTPVGVPVGSGLIASPGSTRDVWGDTPVVLLRHHPIASRADAFAARGLRYPSDAPVNPDNLIELLRHRTAPTLLLNGHLHARDQVRLGGAVTQLTVAALVEAPFDATIIDFGPTAADLVVTTSGS
jgi:hypothetical protein